MASLLSGCKVYAPRERRVGSDERDCNKARRGREWSGTHIASASPMTVHELWRLMKQALERLGGRLRAQHGRGAVVLHAFLDRAAAHHRHRGRRILLRRRRRARRALRAALGPHRQRRRARDRADAASASSPKEGAIAARSASSLLIVGATTVLGELQNALDRIWRAPAVKKSSGLMASRARGCCRSR